MIVRTALCCRECFIHDVGELGQVVDALGIYTYVVTDAFPWNHTLTVYLATEFGPHELGQDNVLYLTLIDPDGNQIDSEYWEFRVPLPGDIHNPTSHMVIEREVVFPEPGPYLIRVKPDDGTIHEIPLRVAGA